MEKEKQPAVKTLYKVMRKASYHVHTIFCDGKNTPEEMVEAAIEKKFTDIGFSSHGMYPFSSEWHIPFKDYRAYVSEIGRLKEVYSGRICINMGFEADYLPPFTMPDYSIYKQFSPDYLIGSVHYIPSPRGPGFFTADGPAEEIFFGIKDMFGGDGRKAVETYYGLQRDMIESGSFEIIGHPDVIRKRNAELQFFDENKDWYFNELEKTASAAALRGKFVEINTGGISRGAIDDVYPSAAFLSILHKKGVPIVINSDAHYKGHLDTAYDRAVQAARQAGYRESLYLQNGKWTACPLQ